MRDSLQQALDRNYSDGTLASAVRAIADGTRDPIEQSVLYEASARLAASCDTHAKRGDVQQAPSLMGGAVPEADAQKGPDLG